MRRITVLLLGLMSLALLISMSLTAAPTPVYADTLVQTASRLDGANVYFTELQGEASRFDRSDTGLSRFAGLLTQLGANLFTLEWRTGFPTDADLIVIAGPASDFSADQTARLWSYMNNGGRVLILADTVVETRRALGQGGGLFQLMWADMGLRGRDDVVVTEGEPVTVTALEAVEGDAEATEEPVIPEIIEERPTLITEFLISDLTTHPITEGIGTSDFAGLAFFTARSLEVDAAIQGFTVTPLLFTPEDFYGEVDFSTYLQDGTFAFNIGDDTTRSALPLAAAFENERTDSRIVVIGDRQFATNGGGLRTSPPNSGAFVYPDNALFLINAVSWLLEAEPGAVDFPTPGPTATVTITPSPTPSPMPTDTPTPTPGA